MSIPGSLLWQVGEHQATITQRNFALVVVVVVLFLKLINNSTVKTKKMMVLGYLILITILIDVSFIEKIYETLKTVFDYISKHLEVRQKYSTACTFQVSSSLLVVWKWGQTRPFVFDVIYQTRKIVFEHISKHREESWKYDAQRSIFDEIRGVWIADETLPRVFDISSQSKQKIRSKQRRKIVKIYANQDQVSKPPSQLWFPLF